MDTPLITTSLSYLIIVPTAQPALVYFFQAGVPFPRKNAEGTALAKFIHTPFPIKM